MKKQVIGAALLTLVATAFAADVSPWRFRLGATQITPHVVSGDLSPPSFGGSKVDIGTNTQLSGGITYKFNPHWSLDVPLTLPFEHTLYGAGAIQGVGKLGTTKVLPWTALMQYQLRPDSATVKPYLGAGVTYAQFFAEKGSGVLTSLTGGTPTQPTSLGIASRWAPSLQVGVQFTLTDIWHLDVNYIKTYLRTQQTLSTGQTLDVTLNPSAVSLALGRSF